ncbi:MAG: hypothetical protein U1U88_002240 [Lawsonella clevelandensis]
MVNVLKRCCVALLLTLGVLAGSPAASNAVEPFAMPDSTDVVARNTTLSETDQVKLEDAAVDVRQQLGLDIYFVFVDTYGDLTPAGWTKEFCVPVRHCGAELRCYHRRDAAERALHWARWLSHHLPDANADE